MAKNAQSDDVDWYRPDPRAVLPLGEDAFRIRKSLAKAVRSGTFEVRFDQNFAAVMDACAQPRPGEDGTWINPAIRAAYRGLAELGLGHSVEAFIDNQRVGGLYGVALGSAFLGESMFSTQPFASQVCLVALVNHLRQQGFTLLDVQFVNPHLQQFGVQEIPCRDYLARLHVALEKTPSW